MSTIAANTPDMGLNGSFSPFIEFDIFCDRIPFLSSITNTIDLIAKAIFNGLAMISPNFVNSSHSFAHLKQKPLIRIFSLIFLPVIGNYAYYKNDKKYAEQLFQVALQKKGSSSETNSDNNIWIEEMKSAAELGNSKASLELYKHYNKNGDSKKTALDYLHLSISQENPEAMNLLGIEKLKDAAYQEAFQLFQSAAKQNYAPALCHLGRCYLFHIGTEQKSKPQAQSKPERENAKNCFIRAAELGDPKGNLELYILFGIQEIAGNNFITKSKLLDAVNDATIQPKAMVKYAKGLYYLESEDKNDVTAFEIFKECLHTYLESSENETDNVNCVTFCSVALSLCYCKGIGTEVDISEAYQILEHINHKDDQLVKLFENTYYPCKDSSGNINLKIAFCESCCKTGEMLWKRKDRVSESLTEAFDLFRKAAYYGDVDSIYHMYECYRYGLGVDTDMNRAIEILRVACRSEDPDNLNELGEVLYQRSNDADRKEAVDADRKEAVDLFQKVAEKGLACGYTNLASYYYDISDHEMARKHYITGAKNGDLLAYLGLFDCYYEIPPVTNDPEEDKKKLWDVLNNPEISETKYAYFCRGKCLLHGIGVEKNISQSFEQFTKAKEEGFVEAYIELSLFYKKGFGVEVNEERAIQYLHVAIHEQEPKALYEFGKCYYEGFGVKMDIDTYFTYIQEAAAFDYVPALEALGECYEKGIGCAINLELAQETRAQVELKKKPNAIY